MGLNGIVAGELCIWNNENGASSGPIANTVSEFNWRDWEYQCKTFSQVSCSGTKTQIQDNPNMDHRSYQLTMTLVWTYIIRDPKEVT
jgi:hypothetical protein